LGRVLWNVLTLSPAAHNYPDAAFFRLWNWLPPAARKNRLAHAYGRFLHRRARARQARNPVDSLVHTFFLRNLPLMEVLRRLVEAGRYASGLTLASIGCSSGAELYSTKWALHAARPDLQVFVIGVDLSGTAVAKAERAVYGLQDSEVRRLSSDQIEELSRGPFPLFQRQGDELIVPEALRTDVTWLVSDARDSRLAALLGAHDIVMVNNVLCHMRDQEAEACLRNVVRLVAPGGYLLIYGVNLDVRTFVVREAGLIPVMDDIERVYLADRSALAKWRLVYWGSEPFDGRRPDWAVRYGTVFQRPV
jgi:chemotaxis methyl-accepting protein methylase